MKNTIVMMAVIAFSFSAVNAQQTWDPKKNPTVDSINAKYADKMLPARPPVTIDQVFPVIGQYQSTVNMDASNVTITLDEASRGIVWVTGLPQGKIKAMLKRSPATYRIPAQTGEDGKMIPEGTLIYDKDANTLNIVIGKPYNEEDPGKVFLPQTTDEVVADQPVTVKTKTKSGTSKTKTKEVQPKAWTYTGTKVMQTTASNTTNQ
jgi:hypothetical protein